MIDNVPMLNSNNEVDEELTNLKPGDYFVIRGSRYLCTEIRRNDHTGLVIGFSGKCRGAYWGFYRSARLDVTRIIKAGTLKTRKRASYPFRFTQYDAAFQSDLAKREDKDCTVRALTLAMSLPYEEAHRLLQVHTGRKEGRGTQFAMIEKTVINGFKLTHQKTPFGWRMDTPTGRQRKHGMTIQQFLAQPNLPERCIVGIKGHVAAVINGVWCDTYRPGARSILTGYWTIEKVVDNNI